ncbi:MAG: fructose-1,6-bisphosphatase [Myxococcales bacterium]|nr:fructose-1,6-bisphosphatase [Myxococcales bacterium]
MARRTFTGVVRFGRLFALLPCMSTSVARRVADAVPQPESLQSYLERCLPDNDPLAKVIGSFAMSGKIIEARLRGLPSSDAGGYTDHRNVHGEVVHALDQQADEQIYAGLFHDKLVSAYASEEREGLTVATGPVRGSFLFLCDPLDGSSNLDCGLPVGSIFSVFRSAEAPRAGQPFASGREQVAAGYLLYGVSTWLVFSVGQGVQVFVLDPRGRTFFQVHEGLRMPDEAPSLSYNAGHADAYPASVQAFVNHEKTRSPFSLRYIGALVADFHRVLCKGGLFLYPGTAAHPRGKLRLMYEANPIAFLAEQAGGAASDNAVHLSTTPLDGATEGTFALPRIVPVLLWGVREHSKGGDVIVHLFMDGFS